MGEYFGRRRNYSKKVKPTAPGKSTKNQPADNVIAQKKLIDLQQRLIGLEERAEKYDLDLSPVSDPQQYFRTLG